MIEIPKQNPRDLCRMLGYSDREMKPAGENAVNIVCPFHDDKDPSLTVYDNGCYCHSQCGPRNGKYDFIDLVMKVKGVDFKEAMKILDAKSDNYEADERNKNYIVPQRRFNGESEKYSDMERQKVLKAALKERYANCKEEYDQRMVEWLEKKQLTDVAKELGYKWHDGNVIKFRGEGIVFPYIDPTTGEVESLRMREWNETEHKFDKVKGLKELEPIPYRTTFRPNSVVFIAEGESSPASLYLLGCSVVGIPGAGQVKAINSAIEWLGSLDYVKTIIACGDNDEAGTKMNMMIRSAVNALAPHLNVAEYKPDTQTEHADINDDLVNGLLKVPIQFTANYVCNYDRQSWAIKDFSEAVNKTEEAIQNGAIWVAKGNVDSLVGKDGKEIIL